MITMREQVTDIPTWVTDWYADLKPVGVESIITSPETTAIFSTDMLYGFCRQGALSSERVGALETPVRTMFEMAYAAGVRKFVLTQDTHHPQTPEFEAWPVHCVVETIESEMVPSLSSLPFAELFTVIPKNSLTPGHATGFNAWLDAHPDLRTAIVIGNCTDLCVYQLAMYLRTWVNELNIHGYEVIVPANCVDTYDLSAEVAEGSGAYVHPGEFY